MSNEFLNGLQAASNAVAGNVAGPVDILAFLLRKAGMPVPENAIGGSNWMTQKGLMAPVRQGASQVIDETAGLLGPAMVSQFGPQIARGLLKGGENLAAPRTLNLQRGAIDMKPLSYQIEHKPMTQASGAATLDDLTPAFGDDIYGKNALQYFGSGDPRERAIVRQLADLRGKPDAQVTIYRGVPKDASGINAGDWVTLDAKAAADYAAQHHGGKVVSMKVPASHVTSWADSLLEFGYYPPK